MTRINQRARHRERIAEVRRSKTEHAGAEKVPYPIRLRECEVVRVNPLGAGLIRVTLGGSGAAEFEAHSPDEHVKLIFPDPDGSLRLPVADGLMLRWPRPSSTTREYTVRRYDPQALEIDIDIALHRGGVGSDWAEAVTTGERINVAGPPGGLIVPHTYDNYVLIGDITALPAIARWLEELPRESTGWAIIEVADFGEQIELSAPNGFDIRWLHRHDVAPGKSDLLEREIRTLPPRPPHERWYAWAAGEALTLKPIRRWIRDELRLDKADWDVTGYWKVGVADFDDDESH